MDGGCLNDIEDLVHGIRRDQPEIGPGLSKAFRGGDKILRNPIPSILTAPLVYCFRFTLSMMISGYP
jgi:hypothetical protein